MFFDAAPDVWADLEADGVAGVSEVGAAEADGEAMALIPPVEDGELTLGAPVLETSDEPAEEGRVTLPRRVPVPHWTFWPSQKVSLVGGVVEPSAPAMVNRVDHCA